MKLRRYNPEDLKEMIQLFYDTVHSVNARDYTKAQLDAWAPDTIDTKIWGNSLAEHYTMVCEEEGKVIGFSDLVPSIDLEKTAYLDRLYVHKDFQSRGVATKLVNALEAYAQEKDLKIIFTDASITAKPFFEGRGYEVVQEQQVERRGEILTNFKMKKSLIG